MTTFIVMVVAPVVIGLSTGGLIGFISAIDGADDPNYCTNLLIELMFIIVGFIAIIVMASNDAIREEASSGWPMVVSTLGALVVLGLTVRFYFRRDIRYSRHVR